MKFLLEKYREIIILFLLETYGYVLHYLNSKKIKNKTLKKIKLHLGCGDIFIQNFINIDQFPTSATDYCLDLRRALPFKNNSVETIFSEHVFEHFTYEEFEYLMEECYRVLKPGGLLLFNIPHFEKILLEMVNNKSQKPTLQAFKKDLERFGSHSWLYDDWLFLDHFIHQRGTHKFVATFPIIKRILKEDGFKEIRKRRRINGIDSLFRANFSLYVAAKK